MLIGLSCTEINLMESSLECCKLVFGHDIVVFSNSCSVAPSSTSFLFSSSPLPLVDVW